MSIGDLDERVSLQRVALTPDGAGGSSEAWSEYAEVWARVRPVKGREAQDAERLEATRDYLVTIRYRADVLEADKIVWRSRELNVRTLRDRGPREQYLVLEVELGAAS